MCHQNVLKKTHSCVLIKHLNFFNNELHSKDMIEKIAYLDNTIDKPTEIFRGVQRI